MVKCQTYIPIETYRALELDAASHGKTVYKHLRDMLENKYKPYAVPPEHQELIEEIKKDNQAFKLVKLTAGGREDV